jgi:hypothetical protein
MIKALRFLPYLVRVWHVRKQWPKGGVGFVRAAWIMHSTFDSAWQDV